MEAVNACEPYVTFYPSTWYHIPEDSNLHHYCCGNFRSCKSFICVRDMICTLVKWVGFYCDDWRAALFVQVRDRMFVKSVENGSQHEGMWRLIQWLILQRNRLFVIYVARISVIKAIWRHTLYQDTWLISHDLIAFCVEEILCRQKHWTHT